MPFTLAHPAAVLPLRRVGLPVTAMVFGSMAPDVPIFAGRHIGYGLTHSWPGVVSVDPLLALLACLVWYAVVRDALVDLAPAAVRDRLAAHVRLTGRQWLLVPVAAAVGAATHVCWDAFTHIGRWGVALVPPLDQHYGRFHGYQWAQYLSGVLGLVVLAVAAVVFLAGQRVVPRPRRTPGRRAWLVTGSAGAAVVLSGGVALAAAVATSGGRLDMLYSAVVTGLVALAVAGGLVCLLWRLLAGPAPA